MRFDDEHFAYLIECHMPRVGPRLLAVRDSLEDVFTFVVQDNLICNHSDLVLLVVELPMPTNYIFGLSSTRRWKRTNGKWAEVTNVNA